MSIVVRICAVSAALAVALCLEAALASAADLPNAPSDYPALSSGPGGPQWNPWSGLYVGTGISAWGGKGVKGGVGGEGYLGYDHVFDNGVVVGVRASSGYEPFLWSTPRGFAQFSGTAFAGGEAIVGYQMGQATPYLITGVDLARPTRFGYGAYSALDAVNTVFSGPGAVQAVGTVGVGVNYRINNNFSVGVEAIVHNNVPAGPAAWPY
jgi:opacity protein-like surface antigen